MSKKSEFYNLANLYSSEILNEGFLSRTAKGAVKGAGAGGLIGGALGVMKGGMGGALGDALAGASTGALMGGAANAALGRDDDEEDQNSIEMTLPKNDISCICKALKKALGAEEDSEEEYSNDEDEDTRIFSDKEAQDILNNTPKTTTQPVASMTPGADALKSPGGSMKDIVSQGVRTDLGQNPAGVTAVKTSEPWIKQAVSDMPEGPMKEIGKSFGAPAADAAADTATSAATDAAAGGTLETIKNAASNMNPWLLGGLAAGGGLLAGKMLGGKNKEKEEEEDSFVDAANSYGASEKGTGALLKNAAAPSKGIADTVMGGVKNAGGAAAPSTAGTFSGAIGSGASKAGGMFGDLASKAGEFVSNMHPAAKLGLAAGGGYLASKLMDDDEEEGGNDVSKALEYSRNEISSRLDNVLNSLEEFDIKKARDVLKNLINDL